jgi:hypothetical protein
MTPAGEHLYLGDDRGTLELANLWADEVEECVLLHKAMPEYVVAISLDPLNIRDLTRDFWRAVDQDPHHRSEVEILTHIIREGKAA